MSSFFTKNRQPPRWQRKQTAINSHNDQFTIYAQMNHYGNTSSNNNSNSNTIDVNMSRNREQVGTRYGNEIGVMSRGSCVETPVSHQKIGKMRETLKNMEMVNNPANSKATSIQLNYSNPNSIHNSRNTYQQQQYQHDRSSERQQKYQLQPQQNINKTKQSLAPPTEQYLHPNPSPVYTDPQQQPETDYNRKLDQLKQRLQLISRNQYQHNRNKDMPLQTIQSPQTSLKNTNSRLNHKPNSQQSTTRNPTKQINNNIVANRSSQTRTSKQYNNNKIQDNSINGIYCKNTVPMPTIIHENQDDTEMEQDYRIGSATVQLQQYPTRDRYKNNSKYINHNNNRDTDSDRYQIEQVQYANIGKITNNNSHSSKVGSKYNQLLHKQHKYNNNYSNSANNSYGNTLSHKKSVNNNKQIKSQFYYQLFPSYSEELDMKVYKDHAAKDTLQQEPEYRIKQQLDKMGGSIWVKPPNSNTNKNKNKTHNNSHQVQHHHNQSSKSTKRRDSATNIAVRTKIAQQQANNQRTRSKSKTIPNTHTNMNHNNRYQLSQSKQKSQISSSYSNNKLISKKQPYQQLQQYQQQPKPILKNINNYTNPTLKTSKKQVATTNKYKLHRAMMKQILLSTMSEDSTQIFTASADYTVKHHIYNKQQQHIQTNNLYRHRASVNSLIKINNIIFSTSNDHYLKYTTINTSLNAPPQLTNQYMYRFPSCPLQLVCANQANLLLGCKDTMYLFDVDRCEIRREIDMGGYGGRGYRILENGSCLYIGSCNTLDLLDFRCHNPVVSICQNLPNVANWMMHPIEDYCLINTQNNIRKIDFRSIKSYALNNLSITIPESQTIVDSCWHNAKISQSSKLFKDNQQSSLLMLTQQIIQNTYINRVVKLDINTYTYQYLDLNLSQQPEQYKATIINPMNIIRQYDGNVYLGDKMGDLYVRDCWDQVQLDLELEVNQRDRFIVGNSRGKPNLRIH